MEVHWVNWIGIGDGKLVHLTYEPQSGDAPDYHGQKFAYSMTTLIVNDDKRRIQHYQAIFGLINMSRKTLQHVTELHLRIDLSLSLMDQGGTHNPDVI